MPAARTTGPDGNFPGWLQRAGSSPLQPDTGALLRIIADAALLVDGAGRLVAMNEAAERLLGRSAGEAVGADASLTLPAAEADGTERRPAEGARLRLVRTLAVRTGQPAAAWPLASGRSLSVSVSQAGTASAPLYLALLRELPPPDGIFGREILQLAVEQSQAGILITCTAGRIVYANHRMSEITGWTQDELVGSRPALLKSDQTPPEVYAQMWQNLRAGRPWQGQLRNRRKDGSLYWVDNRIAPVRDATGAITHFIAVEQDITEMRRQEAELRRTQAEAELANRTKSKFLSNMSHELRTPLNAILGFSQMMEQETFGPLGNDRYRDYATHILTSGKHLQAIIDDMLDLSQIELGRPILHESVFDPMHEVETCAGMLHPKMAEAGLAFAVQTQPDLPQMRGDPLRFRQILINLLSNALAFTRPGGLVVLAADCNRPAGAGGTGLTVEVRDTGIGMTPAQVEKALHPFRPGADAMVRRPGGAGLGLAIVAGIVEQHGGRLAIDSHPGRGTSVTVTFPAARLVPAQATAAEA
ncbi:PAS domain-containing sensor histidine kinase [Marinibaculum pumilum]|uniref:histidine kinase n=1 Tax=Marinibaculum pumilum TaxID=1766165 RepID=A0ABV7L1T1_9PROT